MPTVGFSQFGDRLRRTREAAGLTREDVAQACGRSAAVVASWEQGRHRPYRRTILAVADVLGVTVADLDQ